MPEVVTQDARLHVEVDGEGEPVCVLAHGLTNSCRELAAITPVMPGTKVRFCFRGHGHSSSPERGYRFADFARDVEAVADAHGATIGCGTSLGAGAIMNLLTRRPDRFDKLVFLLPAGLDVEFPHKDRLLRTATLVDGLSQDEAIETLLADPGRLAGYLEYPFLRDMDRVLLRDFNSVGVPRAIRELIHDRPLEDREQMRAVTAPTLFICREGDEIHPADVGRILCEIMPNAELLLFRDGREMYDAIPRIVMRVRELLSSP